jgi:hypothetical protein
MDALLTAIVVWLSANFELPAYYVPPKVEFAQPIEIAFLRYEAFTKQAQQQVIALTAANAASGNREVVSVYDARRKRILLPEGWQGRTPAELSIVVHEMVHHLQHAAGLKYGCPAERETLAYAAQEKWLALFGLTLESEFQIDVFTRKISTLCSP